MTFTVKTKPERDSLLSNFGQAILLDRYVFGNETPQDVFARVAGYYADSQDHADRLYEYISRHWFMPATPVLANGGTKRGLPISCFLNESDDSLKGINDMWSENVWLASSGGGIGSYVGNIRSINEPIKNKGFTSGIVPFIKVVDSMTLAISQGSLRRGSAAVYLPVWHPEIEEFVDIRRPTGGDANRRCLNVHHGVVISDDFMKAVESGSEFELKSPASGEVMSKVSARDLWVKILNTRVETGEPYMLFEGNVQKNRSAVYEKVGLFSKTSNLCSEIMLHTGKDYLDNQRTAVCCLSSLNLEYYQDYEDNDQFFEDIMRFLDNVLEDFIKKAPDFMSRAKYSAMRERSVGLGVMGFFSFLQKNMISAEGVAAKSWNNRMFKRIRQMADLSSQKLAKERGACPDAIEAGLEERFSNKLAVAPTASISIISGNTSPGIEPYAANVFTQKTLSGSFIVKNKYLLELLRSKGKDNDEVWSSITTREGSVQHLHFLTEHEKLVFKTARELNQLWLIEHAADRQSYIDQGQSLNIFVPANINKKDLHMLHYQAWKKGVKSFYYCRSMSIQRADNVSSFMNDTEKPNDECLACQ